MTERAEEGSVPCGRCGYDLRSAPAGGVCPECGLAVAASAAARREMAMARPAWLARVAAGAAVLLAVGVAVVPAIRVVVGSALDHDLATLVAVVGGHVVLQLVGVWLVTAGDPHADPDRPLDRRRRRLRAWAVVPPLAVGSAAGWAAFELRPGGGGSLGAVVAVGYAAALLLYVADATCWAMTFVYLRRLAARVGRRRLAEHGGIVAAGIAASAACLLVVGGTAGAGSTSTGRTYVLLAVGVSATLFGGWALLLLGRFVIVVWRVRRAVQSAWAAVDASTAGPSERGGR